jgi:hypothetical protein
MFRSFIKNARYNNNNNNNNKNIYVKCLVREYASLEIVEHVVHIQWNYEFQMPLEAYNVYKRMYGRLTCGNVGGGGNCRNFLFNFLREFNCNGTLDIQFKGGQSRLEGRHLYWKSGEGPLALFFVVSWLPEDHTHCNIYEEQVILTHIITSAVINIRKLYYVTFF